MTDIVGPAAEAMRRMPPAERDSMAQAILSLAEGKPPLDIEPEHLPFVLEGPAQIERGDFATDEERTDAFRSFGR